MLSRCTITSVRYTSTDKAPGIYNVLDFQKEDVYTDMLQGTLPVKNKRYQKNVICSGKIEKMGVENRDFPDFLVLLFQK